MRKLSNVNARFADDRGDPDPATRVALARACEDHRAYTRALVALCSSRLLMPIVTVEDETGHLDSAAHKETAAVKLVVDGIPHLLAFTGLDAMQVWSHEARPVLCTLDELCATVPQADAERILIDCAGPWPLVIEGEAMSLFAQGYAVAEFEGEEFAWVRCAQKRM